MSFFLTLSYHVLPRRVWSPPLSGAASRHHRGPLGVGGQARPLAAEPDPQPFVVRVAGGGNAVLEAVEQACADRRRLFGE